MKKLIILTLLVLLANSVFCQLQTITIIDNNGRPHMFYVNNNKLLNNIEIRPVTPVRADDNSRYPTPTPNYNPYNPVVPITQPVRQLPVLHPVSPNNPMRYMLQIDYSIPSR